MSKGYEGPAAPDYDKLIPLQEQSNRRTLQYLLDNQRVNEVTPQGTSSWQRVGGGFDQNGYDAAMQAYNQRRMDSENAYYASRAQQAQQDLLNRGEFSGVDPAQINVRDGSFRFDEAAPSRDAFTQGGTWQRTIALSPEQQALQDSDNRIKLAQQGVAESMLGRVGDSFSRQLTQSDLSATPLETAQRTGAPQLTALEGMQSQGPRAMELAQALAPSLGSQIRGPGRQARFNAGDATQRSNDVAQALYDSKMRFMEPKFQEGQDALETQLLNRGFSQGSTGYDRALRDLRNQQDSQRAAAADTAIAGSGAEDSRLFGQDLQSFNANQGAQAQNFGQRLQSAGFNQSSAQQLASLLMGAQGQDFQQQLQGYNTGTQAAQANNQNALSLAQFLSGEERANTQLNNQARAQNLAEQLQLRQLPLNELNAFRTGSQVIMPNTQGQYSTPNMPFTDHLGAAQADFQNQMGIANANSAANSQMMSGIMGLAGTALGAPASGSILAKLLG